MCHDLIPSLQLPREERGHPLHQLFRGEAQDGTVGKDGRKHHPSHDFIPDTNVLAPAEVSGSGSYCRVISFKDTLIEAWASISQLTF